VQTFVDADVDVCFANPGTSEMHFVAALDRVHGMRCVLGLFEGVVTGAADGYARMADKPAVTLLHLGPGFGNGFANIHNARKAQTAMINVVGEHATYHVEHDAPLTADIEGIAGPVSDWIRYSRSSDTIAADGAAAVAASRTHPGQIATLILPANTAWGDANGPAPMPELPATPRVPGDRIDDIAKILKSGESAALVLCGDVVREEPLAMASQICEATGAKMFGSTSHARLQRGAGRAPMQPLPFAVDLAVPLLKEFKHLILVGAKPPVAFFAYPGKPSTLWPEGCELHRLSEHDEDGVLALEDLRTAVNASSVSPILHAAELPSMPTDEAMSVDNISRVIANHLPDNVVVAEEAITSGRAMHHMMVGAAQHDWLQICGGAIGDGIPLAIGAAIACPDRKVLALQADGSGMYTIQGLWTQARENLDITTVVFSNRAYQILKGELKNVGVENPAQSTLDMLELNRPDIDWVKMAQGQGVEAARATTISELVRELKRGFASEGPYLIEAVM